MIAIDGEMEATLNFEFQHFVHAISLVRLTNLRNSVIVVRRLMFVDSLSEIHEVCDQADVASTWTPENISALFRAPNIVPAVARAN